MAFVARITALLVLAAACQRAPRAPGDRASSSGEGGADSHPCATCGGAPVLGNAGIAGEAGSTGGDEGAGVSSAGRPAASGGEGGRLADLTAGGEAGNGGSPEDTGGAGGRGPVELAMHLSVGFNLEVELETFGRTPRVITEPQVGALRVDGGRLVYTPRWAWVGPDDFVVQSTRKGIREGTRVGVRVESPWLFMRGVAYRVNAMPELERVFDAASGAVFGEVLGRGVRVQQGTLAFSDHDGAPAFLRRALPSGRVAGYAEMKGGATGLLFRSASGAAALHGASGAAETRWYSGDGTWLAGQARGLAFAEDRFQAIRCDERALDCSVLSPDVQEDARALFVAGEVTLGSVGVGLTERACVWTSARCEIPRGLEALPARLVGRDANSRALATVFDAWGYPAAALADAEGIALAMFPTFYGVELTGYTQDRALTGALHQPDGTLAGMIADEVAAVTGFAFRERNEPDDPSVRHACLHTQEGPFSALAATIGVGDAPAMSRTHVSYSIGLPPDGSGYVALSVPREGDYSLFLDGPTNVAFDADASIEVRTLRSDHCERIHWIQELRFPQAGTFHLRLSSRTSQRVALVLEAGHAFPWP